jgi:chemotaxis protein CheD
MKIIGRTNSVGFSDEINSRFLLPGEFFFSGSKYQIHTLLGSCIAITLWHPRLKIGGMCHFVLPSRRSSKEIFPAEYDYSGSYCDEAMVLFEREALQRGTKLKDYVAKIFGGSNMLANSALHEDASIGTQNTKAAVNHLAERGVSLLIAHVGEKGHRRIAFDLETGDVWVKHASLQNFIPDKL